MGNYWFSENLRNERKKRNLSQKEFAKKLGVSQNTISNWENCDRYPTIDKVIDIANILGVSVSHLLEKPQMLCVSNGVNKKF